MIPNTAKKAVIYGGGNIGRGFVGQLFYESGYETVFIDVNKEMIDLLNEKKEYPIKFAENNNSGDTPGEIIIKNVRGIDGSPENSEEIAEVIANADIMATSVGVNVLKFIMKPIAAGINKRFGGGNSAPLNIILCENLVGAEKYMRGGVLEYIDEKYKNLYAEKIGFPGASIERTVPIQTDEMKSGDPLRIVAENYDSLPVDKDAFKGEIPDIKNMTAYSPFSYFIERKLYLHNMGHSFTAFLGSIYGFEYIWQTLRDPDIAALVTLAMERSGYALSKRYNADSEEIYSHVLSLVGRFSNKALGDTVKRVGIDLKRKLSPNDRMTGAYKLCLEHNVHTVYACLGIAAGLNFKGDILSGKSPEEILTEAGSYDFLRGNFEFIKKYDGLIKSGADPKTLLFTAARDESGD